MDKAEPALKPQWMWKLDSGNVGAIAGGSLRPNPSTPDVNSRRGLKENSGKEPKKNLGSQSTSSSWRQSKDLAGKSHGYGSFGRSNRERVRDKGFDIKDTDDKFHGSLALGFNEKVEHGKSRRDGSKYSTPYRGHNDKLSSKFHSNDATLSRSNSRGSNVSNGTLPRSDADAATSGFAWDFPSLGVAEKNERRDALRVSSGTSATHQSTPLVIPPICRSNGWNSILLDAPKVNEEHLSSSSPLAPQESATIDEPPETTSTITCVSMAETVGHASLRPLGPPSLLVDPQKMEERELRQLRQLLPRVPSAGKNHVSSSLQKLKPMVTKCGDPKVVQSSFSHHVDPTLRAAAKPDWTTASQTGNLQILNRDNHGVLPCNKNKTTTVISVSPLNQKPMTSGRASASALIQCASGEKRSHDRREFFKAIHNNSVNNSKAIIEPICDGLPMSNLADGKKDPCDDAHVENSSLKPVDTGSSTSDDTTSSEDSQRPYSPTEQYDNGHNGDEDSDYSDDPLVAALLRSLGPHDNPKEINFLRSLGWDEKEEGCALTDLEIEEFNGMYKEYVHARRKVQPANGFHYWAFSDQQCNVTVTA